METMLTKHSKLIKDNAYECTLFLKNDHQFPLKTRGKLILIGNGVRHTLKGGAGSGDVYCKEFLNIEEAFIDAGFEITSRSWLDEYDKLFNKNLKSNIKYIKKEAKKFNCEPIRYAFGVLPYEKERNLKVDFEGDAAIYVLSRQSCEGADRRLIKGDVYLTDSEINEINYLNEKFEKFLLVLNTYGVIDLSGVENVKNILLLSQLGASTAEVLVDIVLGKVNPSGKLADTWAYAKDYKFINEFANLDDTFYKDDIYVGYRYFDSFKVNPLFEFGFGLSYTNFEINFKDVKHNKSIINVLCDIKNIGEYSGKEVTQLYVSPLQNNKTTPYQNLVGFAKTKLLKPNEIDKISISFDMKEMKTFDEKDNYFKILKGKYLLKLGNSSRNLKTIALINIEEDILLEHSDVSLSDKNAFDITCNYDVDEINIKTEIHLNTNDFEIDESKYSFKPHKLIDQLNDRDLIHLSVGQYGEGMMASIGSNGIKVAGAAGETTNKVSLLNNKSIVMADGPAGIRISPLCGKDEKGVYSVGPNLLLQSIKEFLPFIVRDYLSNNKQNNHRKGERYTQYTTPLPSATACAQSFNTELLYKFGKMVSEEMEYYNIQLWLAPAMNIHRNILCGRNFEYYSEDPYLTSEMAIAIIKGVQSNKKCGVTIKHFACNNQEFNRFSSNSVVSNRALREIYLKAFEKVIKEAKPCALMTSYNLLNGKYVCANQEIITDIVRKEWGYNGLIITDWMNDKKLIPDSKYNVPKVDECIKAGVNLFMPGTLNDINLLESKLINHELNRDLLVVSSTYVLNAIVKLNS